MVHSNKGYYPIQTVVRKIRVCPYRMHKTTGDQVSDVPAHTLSFASLRHGQILFGASKGGRQHVGQARNWVPKIRSREQRVQRSVQTVFIDFLLGYTEQVRQRAGLVEVLGQV